MKYTILNGNNSEENQSFDEHLNELLEYLKSKGNEVFYHELRKLNLLYCTGCWGCWVKTPGECLFPDDTIQIRKDIIRSDKVIFASPMILGFPSALLKMVQDKLIALVHPYIELVDNECHHFKRYDHYPEIALVYQRAEDTDKDDIEIVTNIYKRFALNFKSKLIFSKDINEPTEELANALNHY